jgi:hypothetical protein
MPPKRQEKSSVRSGRFKFPSGGAGGEIISGKTQKAAYRFFNSGESAFKVSVAGASDLPLAAGSSLDLHIPASKAVSITKTANADDVEGLYDRLSTKVKIPVVTRSGRFQSKTAKTSPVTILRDRDGFLYRCFNSGPLKFTITANDAGPLTIHPFCSLDVFVSKTLVEIAADQDQQIRGVYDVLLPGDGVRSGRFKFAGEDPLPANGHPIINFDDRTGQEPIYRIFNSGDSDFEVKVSGATGSAPILKPEQSIDVELPKDGSVAVVATAVNKPIAGIYEYLGEE